MAGTLALFFIPSITAVERSDRQFVVVEIERQLETTDVASIPCPDAGLCLEITVADLRVAGRTAPGHQDRSFRLLAGASAATKRLTDRHDRNCEIQHPRRSRRALAAR